MLKFEGAKGLVELLKADPELLANLFNRIAGLDVAATTQTTTFAKASTGRLHVILRCAEQPKPSDEDIQHMIGAAGAIVRDAKTREIARSEIVIAEATASKTRNKNK